MVAVSAIQDVGLDLFRPCKAAVLISCSSGEASSERLWSLLEYGVVRLLLHVLVRWFAHVYAKEADLPKPDPILNNGVGVGFVDSRREVSLKNEIGKRCLPTPDFPILQGQEVRPSRVGEQFVYTALDSVGMESHVVMLTRGSDKLGGGLVDRTKQAARGGFLFFAA